MTGFPFRDPVDGENRKELSFYSLASFPAEHHKVSLTDVPVMDRLSSIRILLMRQSNKYKVVPREDAPFRIDFCWALFDFLQACWGMMESPFHHSLKVKE